VDKTETETPTRRIGPFCYEIPKTARNGMRVPGIIFADDALLEKAQADRALEQVINVSFLPGILRASMAMPDIHWGYGFPIGGVAAIDLDEGVISPGGVGFDISCGVRLIRTDLAASEARPVLRNLLNELSRNVPKGVGSRGKIKAGRAELSDLMLRGARWAVDKGYGWDEDIEFIEEKGCLSGADPDKVSDRAFERGKDQAGTLGAGNHFLEVQEVAKVYEPEAASILGLREGQLVVMIHSGSRGVGHQICTDYVKIMDQAVKKFGISMPDRQLACAPIQSDEGRDYYMAMAAAVNYALVNRQCMAHWVRVSFQNIFKKSAESLGMKLVYDVSHNTAKFEEHEIGGQRKKVCVHRKGATRAFGPGHPDLPAVYREIGQPVIIPGDMGTCSFILVGTRDAMGKAFGSTCHGAGRAMSRSKAKKTIRGDELKRELESKGILVQAGHMALLAEEAPQAYKDVSEVVDVCQGAGLSRKVAQLKPLAVLKG
jgi:tRNA-splicing ligase RtcB